MTEMKKLELTVDDVWFEVTITVRPELNTRLGLPDKLRTRPGISHQPLGPEGAKYQFDAGLRAIEHRLIEGGYIARGGAAHEMHRAISEVFSDCQACMEALYPKEET